MVQGDCTEALTVSLQPTAAPHTPGRPRRTPLQPLRAPPQQQLNSIGPPWTTTSPQAVTFQGFQAATPGAAVCSPAPFSFHPGCAQP